MGLVQAFAGAAGGTLADQWLDVIEPVGMGEGVMFAKGQPVQRQGRRRGANRKATPDIISDGSAIHVYDRQAMLLVDSGAIAGLSMEPGIYTVSNSTQPSIFVHGDVEGPLRESFNRFRYGGQPSQRQQVFYVNLQEIKNIRFGTANPLNYFDEFYGAELFLRCHGAYSLRVVDPILFYQEVVSRGADRVHVDDVKGQYMSEFLEALQASINQMSVDGIRISQVASKSRELSKYMADTLDGDWRRARGLEIVSVGLASISYDEESRKLIDMRNRGAMLSDPTIREGFVQGSVASGLESAGSNPAGAGAAFMGMGFGMNAGGGFMGGASETNRRQMEWQQQQQQQQQRQQQQGWGTPPGAPGGQAPPAPTGSWTCAKCGADGKGKFCSNCGNPAPAPDPRPNGNGGFCGECGNPLPSPAPKFCPNCGHAQG